MKKIMLSLIVVLLISLLAATPLLAIPPDEASGTFSVIDWETPEGTTTFSTGGTFVGIMTMHYLPGNTTWVICDPCTVGEKTGTAVFNVVLMNYKHERGNWNSLYATGELEGLHFRGKHERPLDSPDGIYYGKIHFDPQ